jgi:hypothetical protein
VDGTRIKHGYNEGNGIAQPLDSAKETIAISAELNKITNTDVIVPISYTGTATAGTDYTNAPTSITIVAGSRTGSANFTVVGDTTVELHETIVLTMGTPTGGATLGTDTTFTYTIQNDDIDRNTQPVNIRAGYHVRIEDGVVKDVWDTAPDSRPGWKSAIEVKPTLISDRQHYSGHTFDLTKDPVEIVYGIVDISVADRKVSMKDQAAMAFNVLFNQQANSPSTYDPVALQAAKDSIAPNALRLA